jgi:hypothetical protein
MKGNNPRNPICAVTITGPHMGFTRPDESKPVVPEMTKETTRYVFAPPEVKNGLEGTAKELSMQDCLNVASAGAKRARRAAKRIQQ